MASANEFRITGLKELVDGLREFLPKNQTAAKLRSALRFAGMAVKEDAEGYLPANRNKRGHYVGRNMKKGRAGYWVATPFAKDQVKVKSRTHRDKNGAWAAISVHPDAFYAVNFVELGAGGQDAQEWLVPAHEGTSREQIARIKEKLQKILQAEAKKVYNRTRAAR